MKNNPDRLTMEINLIVYILDHIAPYVDITTPQQLFDNLAVILKTNKIEFDRSISGIMDAIFTKMHPQHLFDELKNNHKIWHFLNNHKITPQHLKLLGDIADDDTILKFDDHVLSRSVHNEEDYDAAVDFLISQDFPQNLA